MYQEKEKESHDHGRGSNALNLGSCVVAVARNPVRPVTCSKHPRVLGFLQFDPGALIWWRCVATMGLLFSRLCCTRTRSRLNVDPHSSLRILLPVVLRFQSQKRHSRPGPSLLLYPPLLPHDTSVVAPDAQRSVPSSGTVPTNPRFHRGIHCDAALLSKFLLSS